MQKLLFSKLAAIGLISFLILFALRMIEAQIDARSSLQESVLRNIAESSAGAQTLIGPTLLIRYKEEREEQQVGADGKLMGPRLRLIDNEKLIPAAQLVTRGQAHVETRQRGIYRGQLYQLGLTMDGEIELPERLESASGKTMISPQAYLVMSVSDLRGVDNIPTVTINGRGYKIKAGGSRLTGENLYAELGPITTEWPRKLVFSLPLNLTGTQSLAIAPVAANNIVELNSDWPHPSFGGRFLPRKHDVGKQGFSANWQVSYLSRNFERAITGGNEVMNITLMDPVNIYLLAIRAVKYGILFVLLTFGAFFITESLRRSPIHPMQYLLVGLALTIFFLLLIALSEHVSFPVAYLVAASACIGLITVYLSGALGGWNRGLSFGAGLTGLYGVLFGILHSEDNALLIGTLLLFIALGAVMLGTRKLDWYRLGNEREREA